MTTINLNNYEAYLLDYFEGNLSGENVQKLKAFIGAHPELGINLEEEDLPVFTSDETSFVCKNELLKSSDNFPFEELLNYIEGNLSISEKIELENKLYTDTELAKELELLKMTVLASDEIEVFDSKKILLKNEDEFILNNQALLYFEKGLSEEDRKKFESRLRTDEALQKELHALEKTKLSIEPELVYPNKEDLKKEGRVVGLFTYGARVAAALLIVIGAAVLFTFYNNGNDPIGKNIAHKTKNGSFKKTIPFVEQQSIASNSRLIAAKSTESKNSKEKRHPLNTSVGSNVAAVANSTTSAKLLLENKNVSSEDTLLVNTNKADSTYHPASENNGPVIRYTNMNALALVNDTEDEAGASQSKRKGFWKRAVHIAQQANGLGLKAVKGNEKENDNYSLSFNSFSVEKK